jgi:peroxiredoxin
MTGKLRTGDRAPSFQASTATQENFASKAYLGKRWLLSFHRYAT